MAACAKATASSQEDDDDDVADAGCSCVSLKTNAAQCFTAGSPIRSKHSSDTNTTSQNTSIYNHSIRNSNLEDPTSEPELPIAWVTLLHRQGAINSTLNTECTVQERSMRKCSIKPLGRGAGETARDMVTIRPGITCDNPLLWPTFTALGSGSSLN